MLRRSVGLLRVLTPFRRFTPLSAVSFTRRCEFRDGIFTNLANGLIRTYGIQGREMGSGGKCDTVDYNELVALLKEKKIILIDVREPQELQEEGQIPGSVNIPLNCVKEALGCCDPRSFKKKYKIDKPNTDSSIVFHCRSGGRSGKALKIANELGYTNAKHYGGGFQDWLEHTGKHRLQQ